jgi:hypothetical protein
MKIRQLILVLTFSGSISGHVLACKCGQVGIEREVDKAYDIVIGKIVLEKEDTLSCGGYGLDYSYNVDVQFSYKEQIKGVTKIFGGKGGGGCGGIFQNGKEYLIVIYKCEQGLYTYMCSDHASLDDAKYQVTFLNAHFKKDYPLLKFEFLMPAIALILLFLAASGIVTFNYYKRRLGKKN